MAALDRYQQTQMVMHQLYKARITGKCIICGGPKKHRPNVSVPRRRCHLYSDALWSAWLQWQQNAKQLAEQHSKLCGGYVPQELLTIGMW